MIGFGAAKNMKILFLCGLVFVSKVNSQMQNKGDSETGNKAVSIQDDTIYKSENRSGIRLVLTGLVGAYDEKNHLTDYTVNGVRYPDQTTDFSGTFPAVKKIPFVTMGLLFSIKHDKYLTFDIGPSMSYGSVKFGLGTSASTVYSNSIRIYSLHSGVNFNKRWYPYKLNIGILVDGNYLHYIGTNEQSYPNEISSGGFNNQLILNGFNVSYGLRVGGEYLIGKHWGVNVDLDYIQSSFQTLNFNNTVDLFNGTSVDKSYKLSRIIDIPPVGLGIGLNYYY